MSFQDFFVNGKLVQYQLSEAGQNLTLFLRESCGLIGTKIGCGQGSCGACTVILSEYDSQKDQVSHKAIVSCITPLHSVQGKHVLTVEGISNCRKTCDITQNALAKGNGTQCGFCTPGMIMSNYALRQNNGNNCSVNDIKRALQGNLCRCTGYRPILEAFQNCTVKDIEELAKIPCIEPERVVTNDSSQKFTEIENLLKNASKSTKTFENAEDTVFHPKSLVELKNIIDSYKDLTIIGGGISEEVQQQILWNSSKLVYVSNVEEMRVVKVKSESIVLGAAITIQEMVQEFQKIISQLPGTKSRLLHSIIKLTKRFGSAQIPNAVTLAGSIAPGLYDILTAFCAFGVTASKLGNLFVDFEIPFTKPNEHTWLLKISNREDCDNALLTTVAKLTFHEGNSNQVKEVVVCYAGSSLSKLLMLHFTNEKDKKQFKTNLTDSICYKQCAFSQMTFGENFIQEVASLVGKIVQEEGNDLYAQRLTSSLFMKFAYWLQKNLTEKNPDMYSVNPHDLLTNNFKSTQLFNVVDKDQSATDLVHRAIPHASALKHTMGEARYCDDTPKYYNELELAFVLSERAHAKILNVDVTKALEMEGVVGYIDHKDIVSGRNKFGLVEKDEEIFASEKVTCHGQIIGGIVATTRIQAKKAASLVKVEYEDIKPLILTNEDAIKHNSYYDKWGMTLSQGNFKEVSQRKDLQFLDGEIRVGSVDHFYLEPQGCIAIPKGEDGEMEIISSTQNLMMTQIEVANVLGVPANHIVVKAKRIGSGFGGKIWKTCKMHLDRETDIKISGKRHPFLAQYKIGFDSEGRLHGLHMKMFCNGGNSLDVSMAPIERALINIDNAYNIPNIDLEGYICKTNIASNTVFRGSGGPQAVLIIESLLDNVANTVGKDPVEVRKLNMYKEGDITRYRQVLTNCTIRKCWDECLKLSNYYERLKEIRQFNSQSQWVKKGIYVTPCNYGVAYTVLHLNQGASLVHIYTDGSVLINHSGIEIGQGVHTKMIQIATRELGICSSKIHILDSSTSIVPNSTPSSASVTSDINGMAVLNACRELMKRLEPYRKQSNTWEETVTNIWIVTPDIGWNPETKQGPVFNYYSTGAACTEVIIDGHTGENQIVRTDIVMDVGQSLNPAIDIGQIEGGFMQGVGLYALEELPMDKEGKIIMPSQYKIPTAWTAPLEFNVSVLASGSNPKAIYSSKTVGEPPLFLSVSAFLSIKDAIREFRSSRGLSTNFHMDSPITVPKIFSLCADI